MNSEGITVNNKTDIKMTKIQCKICELFGDNVETTSEHGLSDPCHLSSLYQLNNFCGSAGGGIGGFNCLQNNANINYANYGLLNGLYLPQLKDMMLAAYLLRGKFV